MVVYLFAWVLNTKVNRFIKRRRRRKKLCNVFLRMYDSDVPGICFTVTFGSSS